MLGGWCGIGVQGGRGKAWRRGMIGGIDPAKRRGSFGRGGAAGSRPTLGGARGARPTWRPPPRFSRDATEAPLARAARPQQRREATQLGRGGADVRRNSNIGAGELTGIGGGRWQQHRQLVVKGMELWAKLCRKRVDHHKPAIKWRGCSALVARRDADEVCAEVWPCRTPAFAVVDPPPCSLRRRALGERRRHLCTTARGN